MGGKSTPDFGDIATAQGQENDRVVRDQIYANRPSQYTPWGYTNWTNERVIDPATGEPTTRWTQTQGLTPELQDILNKQIAIQGGRSDVAGSLTGRMMDEFGAPIDWGGAPPGGDVPTTQMTLPEQMQRTFEFSPDQLRGRAEEAIYGKGASRLNDRFSGQRQALEMKMRNQGLGPEDAAWQAQMKGLDQQETDAYGQLQMDAITGGRGEQAQLFGQQMGTADFFNRAGQTAFNQNLAANAQNFGQAMGQSGYANQIRQQHMAEEMQKRGFSLNEINALLHGQQVGMPQMPNFSQAGQSQGAPIYQGAVDTSNAQQMQDQAMWSGLGSLAGSAMNMYGMMNMPT